MIKMAKKLSFMVKTVQAELIALSRDSHRRFLNNALTAPVACNVIEGRRLKRKVENHTLPYFVFTCVLRGGGELSLHQKNYKLKPGSAFLRFAGETFSIGRSADYVEYSLVLPADFGLLLKKYGPPDGRVFELELDVPLLNAFRELFDLTRTVNSDALPGAALGYPTVLTSPGRLPEVTRRYVESKNVRTAVALGGPGAVSDGVLRTVSATLGG